MSTISPPRSLPAGALHDAQRVVYERTAEIVRVMAEEGSGLDAALLGTLETLGRLHVALGTGWDVDAGEPRPMGEDEVSALLTAAHTEADSCASTIAGTDDREPVVEARLEAARRTLAAEEATR